MALTAHYYTKFQEGKFYHVYNRTVDKKPMFQNEGNYLFFLKKYDYYLSLVADTYSYCLLGNHFHLLLKVKDDLTGFQREKMALKDAHEIVSHQFRKLFQSYALAFNKQQDRTGTLFQTPFKRTLIDTDHYFTHLVYYIHANPQLHGLIDDFREWKWSSYDRILIDRPSKLQKQEVIKWFGSVQDYKDFHATHHRILNDKNLFLED